MAIVDPIRGSSLDLPRVRGWLKIALSAELGEDITSIAAKMLGESVGPNIHSFHQSSEERANRGRLLLLLYG